ncbi:acyltransferase [uncultured Bacteroides sp.]|uniref:acyltransferase n=1 Tax=uncultured Bacteroides sp. TaxID=162156 RepID=UPI002633FC55|nr:acyltransferase [uncultured Bacteroides sp.]
MKLDNFYTDDELKMLGFKSIGENVKISKKASIYKPELMSIGNNVRIEDYCVLNGNITIGNNVFIAVFCLLDGHSGITLEEDVTFAAKVSIHSGTDDYSGSSLVGSYIPVSLRKKHVSAPVIISKHCIVGDSSVIMPGVTLAEGTAVGALSFIKETTQPWGIYAGVPAKRIKNRKQDLIAQYDEWIKVNV